MKSGSIFKKISNAIRSFILVMIPLFAAFSGTAQTEGSNIEKQSEPITVSFKPKNESFEMSFSFFRFKDRQYGLLIVAQMPITSKTPNFVMGIDSIGLQLDDDKKMRFIHGGTTGGFDPSKNKLALKSIELMDEAQFALLQETKVHKITVSFRDQQMTLTIKGSSAEEILTLLKSF